ncbi:MAG: SLC13 family permease [Gammaproteobacteria bacterium]|nr:SLC13 family permease [Gammaproteobacteria bacterium]
MDYASYITIGIILAAFSGVFLTRIEPVVIFGIAFLSFLVTDLLPIDKAFLGLSNPGVITLAALFIVSAGIKETGAFLPLINALLKPKTSLAINQTRLLAPTAFLSGFLNNTPIVASLIPVVVSWCKKHKISASKLLLPLSYAAILGGTCTLIGTSTNLVVSGLLSQTYPELSLGFFEIAIVGLPITALGIVYLIVFSRFILADREAIDKPLFKSRDYTFELVVEKDSKIVGKTIEEAQLRGLKGAFLIQLMRAGLEFGNVEPSTVIESGDRLVFSGTTDAMSELTAIKGLRHADKQVYKLEDKNDTFLAEVLVTRHNPLIGKSIRNSGFRHYYNAVVIAVIRQGQRINKKTGDVVLKAGDLLLLHADNSFIQEQRYSRDFLLIEGVEKVRASQLNKAKYAWGSLLMVVALATSGFMDMVTASLLGALITIISGCCNISQAGKSIDFRVLALIVIAFGFGEAIKVNGVADQMIAAIDAMNIDHHLGLLVVVYLVTLILTELVTNNAAAVISFSFVTGISEQFGLNIMPFAIVIMIAASASFITPLGYQTNLMVYGAGNYRFSDYIKLGLPLSVMVMLITLIIVPNVWPLV